MTPGPERMGLRGELGVLLFFALASVVLTWPLVLMSGELSLRTDYVSNIWNIWWVRRALFEDGVSPFATELLYFPHGVSLARHTLSPINAFAGALLSFVTGLHEAYRCVLLGHFWASGVAAYVFARHVTGSRGGAVLAGLVWSFAPYHLQCLDRINLASLEGLPLVALFLMKVRQEGGARNLLALLASVAWLTATSYNYVVYAAGLGALMLVGGPLWDRGTPFLLGTRRLVVAGAAAGVVAIAVAWPLVSSAIDWVDGESWVSDRRLLLASNDLLGFRWIVGPPDSALVSWPTMLGYSGLLLVLVGARATIRQPFWIATFLLGILLGLGPILVVGGEKTDVRLPYELLVDLPIIGSMMRRPGRVFLVAQLAFTVLVSFAYRDVASRLGSVGARRGLLALLATLIAFEFASVPLRSYRQVVSPLFAQLPADAESLVELPPGIADINVRQMIHGRRAVGGYVTNMTLDRPQHEATRQWAEAWEDLHAGRPSSIRARIEESGVDLVILDRWEYVNVVPAFAGELVWKPFRLVRGLTYAKQDVPYVERRIDGIARARVALQEMFGEPILEDDRIFVFRATRR